MRQKSTFVALFFLLSGVLLSFVLHLTFTSVLTAMRVNNTPVLGDNFPLSALMGSVIGLVAAAVAFNVQRTNTLVGEVIEELNKVAWPTAQETRINTIVVIVTSVIAALILGVFDITFGHLSTLLAEADIHL